MTGSQGLAFELIFKLNRSGSRLAHRPPNAALTLPINALSRAKLARPMVLLVVTVFPGVAPDQNEKFLALVESKGAASHDKRTSPSARSP